MEISCLFLRKGVERNTCDEGIGSIVSSANSINMAQLAISNNLAHDTCV